MSNAEPVRVLELFAGIGGLASAWPEATVVAAVDINTNAKQVYERNHSAPFLVREIESLDGEELMRFGAEFWWMSPPCQPFTVRGKGKDIEDARCKALLHLLQVLPICRPKYFALENVLGFKGSKAHELLRATLERSGYVSEVLELCPSDFGWPNRRPRLYVLACQEDQASERQRAAIQTHSYQLQLAEFTDNNSAACESLWLSLEQQNAFREGLDRVDLRDPAARTACFGSSYGKSLLHAGSYLEVDGRLRRFSPREVARLLGFPDSFDLLEDEISQRGLWKLLGNSLSLVSVRQLLGRFTQLVGKGPWAENLRFAPDCNQQRPLE